MQQSLTNQNVCPNQVCKIKFLAFFLVIFLQPTLLLAADFGGTLKSVTITDQAGANAPPTAVITYTQSGSNYTFDASRSVDPDGSIVQYKWDFGDGSTAATAVAQHQFVAQGEPAKVTLSTIDDKGAVALAQVSLSLAVVYEDAEDGSIARWTISDNTPAGATITNVFDDVRKSRVIELTGSPDTQNAFKLTQTGGVLWGNTKNFVIQWSLKSSVYYEIFIYCQTSAGTRYLKYTTAMTNTLGTGETVTYGLGSSTKDGQWHTITRDLVADLKAAQPGVQLISVNSMTFRGPGRIDDVMLK
ncbi:MAG: PKD domain-containing protein [Desulfobulbaceae bacterium]|nr:PKD domain-containing protein [Desulfobulbaceae bacterium]